MGGLIFIEMASEYTKKIGLFAPIILEGIVSVTDDKTPCL